MKKHIWMAAGIAGMLLGNPSGDAQAKVNIHIALGDRPSFYLDTRPDFIYLPYTGYYISIGAPYDIIFYDDYFYLYDSGYWYRSAYYRGPWIIVRDYRLPYQIRRHRWDDIRRFRDIEYRKHDRRYWENHFDRERYNDNRRFKGNDRDNDNRRPGGNDRDNDNRKLKGNGRDNDNRWPNGSRQDNDNRQYKGSGLNNDNRGPNGNDRNIETRQFKGSGRNNDNNGPNGSTENNDNNRDKKNDDGSRVRNNNDEIQKDGIRFENDNGRRF